MNLPSMFRLAKNVSKLSEHRYPMGCVIIKNGNVISVGENQLKSHPEAWRTGLHCEIRAIKCSGKYDLEGSSIIVYRENKKGEIALSKPCKDCQRVLREKGFKWMYFSIPEYPFFDCERL